VPESDVTWAEGLSRWLARRSTRRSFLGRLGRTAVLVAGGSTLATLLVGDEAEARVCGQSGVSPKCPTYDCDDGIWGWCWYATGCCSGGELKKICDCCAPVDNVHGYCPSGTNVACIVESCGTDPRVQVVAVRRVPTDEPAALSAGTSRAARPEGGATEVWLVEAGQWLLASVLATAGARRGIPVLLAPAGGASLGSALIAELQRLGTTKVVLQGPGLGAGVAADAARYALAVERGAVEVDGSVASLAALSEQLAVEAKAAGVRRAVAVETAGTSLAAAPLAAGLAMAKGYPLIVGVDRTARPAMTLTYLVGPEAAARAGEVPGGHPVFEGTLATIAVACAQLAFGVERSGAGRVALVPDVLRGPAQLAALVAGGGPILLHAPGGLDGVRDALFTHRDQLRAVAVAGAEGGLSTHSYYELQSLVNGFDAHKLIGVAGQGLPVIDQPLEERPVGLARRSSTPPSETGSRYWTGRGLDLSEP
jgi:hypothetical protein